MDEIPLPIHPPPLPTVADGEFHHVDPNAIQAWRIGLAIRLLVLIVVAFVAVAVLFVRPGIIALSPLTFGGWAVITLILGIYSWLWPVLSYRHLYYCLKEDSVIIRKGVLWKMETIVPKSRIQHTDISQGPLERACGISSLIIHTAGTQFALVPLSGIHEELAPRLRNHLLQRRENDDTL